ncbi:uncharacterized protein LOC115634360 [Scaptodrosophila lebanonensis]|uniref:Uncharacterized protein LOC115634360 n=1 Tax=Drosophila lebanonensis TaxID=7225 RepID=A0A6J2UHF9_DROLE|nr:uncharacterized protein LOC115634360 [Scaptodrosophila lebanonensis]XP_030387882.1 uncharacterized protein LOC115634360 [Scaptodrosophila lebanonensis]
MNDSKDWEDQQLLELEPYRELNYTPSIYEHPTLADYYSNMTSPIVLSIFAASLLTIVNISIFFSTVAWLRQRLNQTLRLPSIAMVSLYPIISMAALFTLFVPYSWFVCHTVMHAMFMFGGPIFRMLLFRYVDSEQNYLKQNGGEAVQLNTPPCCCWCVCLPLVVLTKTKMCISRCMVWQMPFVQGLIMLVLNVLYYGDVVLYRQVLFFFIPFIIASVVSGAWSLQITVRMITKLHGNYQLRKKMFCLQLVIVLCKVQYLVLYEQLKAVPLGGDYPMNHTIYKQTIINILILVEMVLVSLFAKSAYRTPVQGENEELQKAEQQGTHI